MPLRTTAGGFLTGARAYADLANAQLVADATPSPAAASPIYFLYSHAAELAFKAFLTAQGMPFGTITNPKIRHNLPELHKTSCGLGLVIGDDVDQVVSLLDSENKHQGFRYYVLPAPPASAPPGTSSSVTLPSLSWVREAVVELLTAVEPHVLNVGGAASGKFTFTYPKPVPKT